MKATYPGTEHDPEIDSCPPHKMVALASRTNPIDSDWPWNLLILLGRALTLYATNGPILVGIGVRIITKSAIICQRQSQQLPGRSR
eukprot:6210774-Pleurochrysis_carterae.AAC.2